jgi:rRNA maturation protein Nop10
MEDALKNICPVCGFAGLMKPAYDKRGFGSLETCPSCGFQFNVSDAQHGWSHRDWRDRWVTAGMPWCSGTLPRPRRWSAKNQIGKLRG